MFQRAYADFQNCCEAGLVRNQKIRFAMLKDRKALMEEIESLEKLLKKTYDVNVIPSRFRKNLYAIYYLHDFVTSSNQSLATAMLHFDLNEIKAKLDRIIDQQEEIIIQQSVIMAQNDQLLQ